VRQRYALFGAVARERQLLRNRGACFCRISGSYEKGKKIAGIEAAERSKSNVDVYHAGTKRNSENELVTNGGRVLAVSAWAETLHDAIATAYESVSCIQFEGNYFRRDIAAKDLRG